MMLSTPNDKRKGRQKVLKIGVLLAPLYNNNVIKSR